MPKLFVENVYTRVEDMRDVDFYKLRDYLSYRMPGFLFSPLYNKRTKDGKRIWDGWIRLIKKNKSGVKFPSGLLSLAKEAFKKEKILYTITDLREKPQPSLDAVLNTERFKLFPYQEDALDSICTIGRGIISAATGSGKTILGAAIISKLKVKPFLFLVTSIDLLEQTAEAFEESLLDSNGQPIKVGKVGGGVVDLQDITVMTVQTAVRVLGKKFKKFDSESPDEKIDNGVIKKYGPQILSYLHECQGVICDECITGDAVVITEDGPVKMENLHEKIGKKVLSFDGNKTIWKKITNFYRKGKRKTLKIILTNNSEIRCTPEHLIKIRNGWTSAEELKKDDSVLCVNNYIKIKSIEKGSEEEVFDISVEDTHCFFANGALVHNCHHWRADQCTEVTNALEKAYYRIGCSATPFRDQDDDMAIQSCFGKVTTNVKASELITSGHLVKPTIYMVHFKPKQVIGTTWQSIYKECVVESKEYNKIVASMAQSYIDAGRLALILVQQIAHGELLNSLIPGSLFIQGDSPKKERLGALKKLQNRYIKCIITSPLFDEGVNIRALNTLILAGGGKSRTRALQRIGRILRRFDGVPKKTDAIAIDFFIHADYLRDHAKERVKIYGTEPEFEVIHIPDEIHDKEVWKNLGFEYGKKIY